jgi:iron complex transport system ATP-binding protein
MDRIAGLPWRPALLLTTHHAEEIANCFTHGLLVKGGGIYAAGRLDEVFTAANLSALFGIELDAGQSGGRWWARAGGQKKYRDV